MDDKRERFPGREAYFMEDGEPDGRAMVGLANADDVQVLLTESDGESISVVLNADEWFRQMDRLKVMRRQIWHE